MKYTPETGFLLDLSPEIGFLQETRFLCTSLTWKVLYHFRLHRQVMLTVDG